MLSKLIIVPNSGLYKKKGTYYIINTLKDFFFDLLQADRNFEIHILAIALTFNKEHFIEKIDNEKIFIHELFSFCTKIHILLLRYINSIFIILKIIRTTKNSFVYIFFPGNISLITSYICLLLKKDFGLYIRGDISSEGIFKKILYKKAIKKAKFCIVTGQKLLNETQKINIKCELVFPMIKFNKEDIGKELKESNTNNYFRFVTVGRLSEAKGIYDLLLAFNNLYKKRNDIELILIGIPPDNEKHRLLNFIDELNIPVIRRIGAIKDEKELKKEYDKANCFILSSHHEGFPRVLYEAMIFGVPIITTDLPGIIHEMKEYINCIKYPVGDTEKLASRMELILLDQNLQSKLSHGGMEFMQDLFKMQRGSHAIQLLDQVRIKTT